MQRKLDLNSNFNLKFTLNDKYLTFWNVVERELQHFVQYLISQLRQKKYCSLNSFGDQTSAGFSFWKDLSFVISHDGKFWVYGFGVYVIKP